MDEKEEVAESSSEVEKDASTEETQKVDDLKKETDKGPEKSDDKTYTVSDLENDEPYSKSIESNDSNDIQSTVHNKHNEVVKSDDIQSTVPNTDEKVVESDDILRPVPNKFDELIESDDCRNAVANICDEHIKSDDFQNVVANKCDGSIKSDDSQISEPICTGDSQSSDPIASEGQISEPISNSESKPDEPNVIVDKGEDPIPKEESIPSDEPIPIEGVNSPSICENIQDQDSEPEKKVSEESKITDESDINKVESEQNVEENDKDELKEIVNEISEKDLESAGPSTEDTNQDIDETNLDSLTEVSETSQDKVQKPQFETAPNVSIDDSQDDHTEALDPFDALLKDTNDPPAETSTQTVDASVNIDDDDDHNVDNHIETVDGEDDHQPDDSDHAEPGADEEVCLLPDTEREISEADKQEAEKALAEKRRQAEAEAMATQPKEESGPESHPETCEETSQNNDTTKTAEATVDGNENHAEKENEVQDGSPDGQALTVQEVSCPVETTCSVCDEQHMCSYLAIVDDKQQYFCSKSCVRSFQQSFNESTVCILQDKFLIDEIVPKEHTCSECEEQKICYFYYKYEGDDTYYCSLACLHSMMADEVEKYSFKRQKILLDEKKNENVECINCQNVGTCEFSATRYGEAMYLCSSQCLKNFNKLENGRYSINKTAQVTRANPPLLKLKVISNATDKYLGEAYKIQAKTPASLQTAREERDRTFLRICRNCFKILNDKMLTWETMDFCNKVCLGRHQNKIGSKCAYCKNSVPHPSLGKYCVRFGYDIRQFCNSRCLEEFKKGLKICCYCQRDISVGHEGFLAPVGDKGQFKDFCSQHCMEKFDQMSKNVSPQPVFAKCAVCSLEKATTIEVEDTNSACQRLCSDPCFAAFKFVNNFLPDQCRWCKKYFERNVNKKYFTIYDDSTPIPFCSKSCINIYISNSRHIVPCNWCKVKKYNFDMIQWSHDNQTIMMCSLSCLNLYEVSVNAVSSRRKKCDMCKRVALAQYHLTMSDATVRNFCTYQCVISFQGQYKEAVPMISEHGDAQAVPTGTPRRSYSTKVTAQTKAQTRSTSGMPVISNVQSLATPPLVPTSTRAKSKRLQQIQAPEPEPPAIPKTPPPPPKPPTPPPPPPPKIFNHVIVKTLPPHEVANKGTMAKPMMVSKGISCRPHPCTKECQTDSSLERKVLIPVPVPIYVPVPCVMWSLPFPVPVPIPLPIPTPVFIPTTRNSAKGIMKEINKIHDKMPTDPFEAELLMMAEMVAGDKKKDQSDSDTDEENEGFSPVAGIDGNNAFGEDVLQMALKMATEYEEQPVDLESAMTANTITPSSHPGMPGLEGEGMHHHHMMVLEQQRAVAALRASQPARKRAPPAPPPRPSRSSKRRREPAPPAPEPPREPAEKPDANMCLKYTFGVNAWKQWVMTKNAEIEKSSIRRKPFKSEILQLTADELNYSLCLFVKEVRKPNGSEYAPDTIYYLVLGIQQYLFENGRIDNIFTDPYYEKFTDCLDEVARKFSVLYNDSQYIVTRVEEEHLWESKQLGAHSPHVLLSTLMFFNTKHFNLVTVDEHMQLSFSHIMKHWKRNPNQPGQAKIPGARNVLLRFYPPQSALEANSRKKKVYEQQENEENPLRCPVKLYEFYISKCPESVRTRNDVFYLQPERSCVPDSPVWYSTQPLSRHALAKMLHRVKMVKEINIALLTS
ncbi:zinc finger MYM-type protein 3 isoform X1 [Pieris napi]|uniref:zinc finger MYM-type protein 3 isoform X1 n=1 Tax=Pieris napi TaxID=78633 RepID=UPI001FBAF348|nr:zinc finger MYM-type protein 3 isoform X1 [Pieris napi]XP_047507987.1 zinc finger MYM-type protein 3 isoform X1 [Pieris napi]XP_047507988.1 zinc finger MYM-type protein 3 isoform X1 [Pieris napi]XP_047507989.1 zinc finger MYM-type protein 3 isoform X1 [Pieris napi]XP_047507990.1 zinc finger MYM-type protein 3 isoform X1 [Pieris napi]